MKNVKICFAASSGGHLEEISQLKELQDKYENFLITEEVKGIEDSSIFSKKYYVPQINRKELLFIFKYVYISFQAMMILRKEKPNYIISTGALCTYPICVIGKIRGVKIIYIESFARCDSLSLTGKLMKKKADKYIVQWKELQEYFPDATYGGGIF